MLRIPARAATAPVRGRSHPSAVVRRGLLALIAVGLGTACAALPPPYRTPPNYPLRFSDVETITLVPPLVSVAAMSSGNIEQEVQEWSDAAEENTRGAVQRFIEESGKTFVPYAGKHPPRPDFRVHPDAVNQNPDVSEGEQSWLLFESAKEAILRHTYDITQLFPAQMSNFDYTLGPESDALLGGTRADAFLLMVATDFVASEDRQALVVVSAAAALATGSYGGPGATPAELTVALVESKTGDVLYFNKVSMPLSDLRDPKAGADLVNKALAGVVQ